MPAVLSKRTADWLRSAMARDSARGFRPRRIAYAGGGGGGVTAKDAIPAVVQSTSTGIPGVYRVQLFPSGIGGQAGGYAYLACTERGMEMDLPAGTVVLAHSIPLSAADDGDDGEQSSGEEEESS